jgi:hypothetical protein
MVHDARTTGLADRPVSGEAAGRLQPIQRSWWRGLNAIFGGGSKLHWLGWLVVVLALIEGGWLAFDGGHALTTGDYVTPRSADRRGQLGPWANLVAAVGIDPRSTLMKAIHVGLGLGFVATTACFALGLSGARTGMILCAVLTLWYLPLGTLLSLIQIVILLLPALRASGN